MPKLTELLSGHSGFRLIVLNQCVCSPPFVKKPYILGNTLPSLRIRAQVVFIIPNLLNMLTPGSRPTVGAGINLQSSRPRSSSGPRDSHVQWNSSITSLFLFSSFDATLACQHCYFLLLSLTSTVIHEKILKLSRVLVSPSRH